MPEINTNIEFNIKFCHSVIIHIIKTISKSKKNSTEKYYTYRLMESARVVKKVKKITLLNLGSNFSLEQKYWSDLSIRIDDIIKQRPRLFEIDKEIESIAQDYAKKVVASRAIKQEDEPKVEEERYKNVDVTSIKNSNPKSIGVESVVYETIKELGLDNKFLELGFTNVQVNSVIGTIIAKIAQT